MDNTVVSLPTQDAIISILPKYGDRFDTISRSGDGWKTVDDETDARSIAISDIKISNIRFESMFEGDIGLSGNERLKNLKKAGHIRLDARVLQIFALNNKRKITLPKQWREIVRAGGDASDDGFNRFTLDGSVFVRPHVQHSGHYVLSVFWCKHAWYYRLEWLERLYFKSHFFSMILEKS